MSPASPIAQVAYQRIATEEAWGPAEMFELYRRMLADKSCDDPGFNAMWGFYLLSRSERPTQIIERLQDIGERRIGDMDATGIARQIVSLTSPGVQVFDAPTATSLAASSNDQLAEAVRRYPDRFTGLAAVAPQDPGAAAKEIERGVRKLGFKGAIINSHTLGDYLDEPRFWEIFAAAEALGVPIYLHPNTPSRGLIGPLLQRGLEGAIYGFGVETGMHLLAIVTSGVFDRFPKLTDRRRPSGRGPALLALPSRLHASRVRAGATLFFHEATQEKGERLPARERFCDDQRHAVAAGDLFCQSVLGIDRVLYAMDYPYQFVPDEVTVSDNLPIRDDDKKKFFQLNAEAVFAL